MENNIQMRNLLDVAEAFQEWIMAVPEDVASRLPAMPGIDGDYAERVLADAREALGPTRHKPFEIQREAVKKGTKTKVIEGKNGDELMRKLFLAIYVPSSIDPSEEEKALSGRYEFWVSAEVSQGVQRLLVNDAFNELEITKNHDLSQFCIDIYDENSQRLHFPSEDEVDADISAFSAVFISKLDN